MKHLFYSSIKIIYMLGFFLGEQLAADKQACKNLYEDIITCDFLFSSNVSKLKGSLESIGTLAMSNSMQDTEIDVLGNCLIELVRKIMDSVSRPKNLLYFLSQKLTSPHVGKVREKFLFDIKSCSEDTNDDVTIDLHLVEAICALQYVTIPRIAQKKEPLSQEEALAKLFNKENLTHENIIAALLSCKAQLDETLGVQGLVSQEFIEPYRDLSNLIARVNNDIINFKQKQEKKKNNTSTPCDIMSVPSGLADYYAWESLGMLIKKHPEFDTLKDNQIFIKRVNILLCDINNNHEKLKADKEKQQALTNLILCSFGQSLILLIERLENFFCPEKYYASDMTPISVECNAVLKTVHDQLQEALASSDHAEKRIVIVQSLETLHMVLPIDVIDTDQLQSDTLTQETQKSSFKEIIGQLNIKSALASYIVPILFVMVIMSVGYVFSSFLTLSIMQTIVSGLSSFAGGLQSIGFAGQLGWWLINFSCGQYGTSLHGLQKMTLDYKNSGNIAYIFGPLKSFTMFTSIVGGAIILPLAQKYFMQELSSRIKDVAKVEKGSLSALMIDWSLGIGFAITWAMLANTTVVELPGGTWQWSTHTQDYANWAMSHVWAGTRMFKEATGFGMYRAVSVASTVVRYPSWWNILGF